MTPPPGVQPLTRAETLTLCAAVTLLAVALPGSDPVGQLWFHFFRHVSWLEHYPHRFADLCLIAVGLMLTLPAARASGLCIGNIRDHWKGVLLLTAGPVLLTVLVYPRLPERPFRGSDVTIWLTSPPAQDLIFGGVVYRLLRPHFSEYVHPRLRMEWVLPIGALFFAAWHLQNLVSMPVGYVAFQLVYTWAAFAVVGLTRQWTGSILYVDLAHIAGNFVPWWVD